MFLINSYGQSSVDSLYENLDKKQRLALLFISGNTSDVSTGYKSLKATDVFEKSIHDITGCVVDVSSGFNDKLQIPFPDFHTLDFISDTGFVKKLIKSACLDILRKGAAGLLFKYSGNPSLNNSPYWFATFADGHFTIKRVAVFDGTPLLKPLKQNESLYSGRLSFSNEHTNFKSWIDLFTDKPVSMDISFEELLKQGTLFYTNNPESSIDKLQRAVDSKTLNMEMIDKYAKRVLALKEIKDDAVLGWEEPEQLKFRWEVWLRSFSIVQKRRDIDNEHSFMSINSRYGVLDLTGNFTTVKSRYEDTEFILSDITRLDSLPDVDQIIIVTSEKDSLPEEKLKELSKDHVLKLIYLGSRSLFREKWLESAGYFDKILFSPGSFSGIDLLLDQVMFGGVAVTGIMPFAEKLTLKGFGSVTYDKLRIGYGFPGLVQMSRDTLQKIDSILNVAVKKRMTPGGQLLVVKDGYVVYDKSFGYATYSKKVKVDSQKIYDLASLTKVVVTLPLVMKLYDEKKIDLNTPLKQYLPETDTLETGHLTIRQLLLHEAGLPSYIPFHFEYVDSTSFRGSIYSGRYSRTYSVKLDKYFYFNKNVRYKSNVFRKRPDSVFNIRISDNMYMNYHYRDSIYKRVVSMKVKPDKEYLYSDMGYYLIQKVIEKQTGQNLDELFRQWFAGSLETDMLVYNPLKYFQSKNIIPSGKDIVFRKEMLQGYVNDDGAAMLGGVAAHAGLFGNTSDLAVFAQMLLNKGSYGGISFITPETLELFTSRQNSNNRRGLGFDKPEFDPDKDTPVSGYASPSSFGHSGFTGTLLWIDPKYNLIYIFLSNRVCPYSYNRKLITENIRTKIQDVIYRSFLPKETFELIDKRGYD